MSALPLYLQVRRVRACLIKALVQTDSGWAVIPDEAGLKPVNVSEHFMSKQRPVVGGYLVIQDDGYRRFATREEIEDGFFLVDALQDRRERLAAQLAEIDEAIEAKTRSDPA